MNLAPAFLLGAGIHAVMVSPIRWVKEEPYKLQVMLASALRGVQEQTIHSDLKYCDGRDYRSRAVADLEWTKKFGLK